MGVGGKWFGHVLLTLTAVDGRRVWGRTNTNLAELYTSQALTASPLYQTPAKSPPRPNASAIHGGLRP